MSGITFSAEPFDSSVLLRWFAGAGSPTSTASDLCEITIQYTILAHTPTTQKIQAKAKPIAISITGGKPLNFLQPIAVPSIVPNTPPYVIRELQQPQKHNNVLYHPNLLNGETYRYAIFVHYMDTGMWEGPIISQSVTPTVGIKSSLVSGSISFTKLESNTRLVGSRDSMVEAVVWLADNQTKRKSELEAAMRQLKPSHVRMNIVYEPYYVAQTTSTQFASGSYDSGSYEIRDGTLINKVATIDYSFSGLREIFGGV